MCFWGDLKLPYFLDDLSENEVIENLIDCPAVLHLFCSEYLHLLGSRKRRCTSHTVVKPVKWFNLIFMLFTDLCIAKEISADAMLYSYTQRVFQMFDDGEDKIYLKDKQKKLMLSAVCCFPWSLFIFLKEHVCFPKKLFLQTHRSIFSISFELTVKIFLTPTHPHHHWPSHT